MLVIFTNYDQVSAVLEDCALQLVKKGNGRLTVKLGPPYSDSKGVQKTLMASENVTLFYFGHGELPPRGLVAQDMKPGIHSKNLDLLKNRLVFATSCYSAQSLAAASKRHGATVIGYRGKDVYKRQGLSCLVGLPDRCCPENHAVGLRPCVTTPDANEGSDRNYKKRIDHCTLHREHFSCIPGPGCALGAVS